MSHIYRLRGTALVETLTVEVKGCPVQMSLGIGRNHQASILRGKVEHGE